MPNHPKYKTIFPLSQIPKSVVVAVMRSALFFNTILINKNTKIMKLELKHLAPYFPYGLKCQFEGMLNNKIEIGRIHKLSENSVSFHHNMFWQIENCKPILRPLLDLEENKENYLFEILRMQYMNIKNPEKCKIKDGIYYGETRLTFLNITTPSGVNELPFKIFSKLLEWHFDVFGLIENGLAISIHDVEQADA